MGSIIATPVRKMVDVSEEIRLPSGIMWDEGFRIVPNFTTEELATERFSIETYYDALTDEIVIRKVTHG